MNTDSMEHILHTHLTNNPEGSTGLRFDVSISEQERTACWLNTMPQTCHANPLTSYLPYNNSNPFLYRSNQ